MAKKTIKIEYTVIPFKDFDRNRPVTSITETNDGYHFVLDLSKLDSTVKLTSSSEYEQGGILVHEHSNILEYIRKEQADNFESDTPTDDQLIEWLEKVDCLEQPNDAMFNNDAQIGVYQITKLPRRLEDADLLYSLIEGEDEDEDDC
jgi:hypothetical protein